MIDTKRSSSAPVGIGTGMLFPEGDHRQTLQPAEAGRHKLGLFDQPDGPVPGAHVRGPQRIIGVPDPHRAAARAARPKFRFDYEQPVTPWYRSKRVWLAAGLLLLAATARLALTPESAQLGSAEVQEADLTQ